MRVLSLVLFFMLLNTVAKALQTDTVALSAAVDSMNNRAPDSLSLKAADSLYNFGKMDSKKYYKGYKMAGTITILSGTGLMLVSPVAGLTTAIICSSTPPKIRNLNLPDETLASNENYLSGYRWQARKIKQRKVWKNWAIGFGINVSIVGLILLIPNK